MGAFSIPEKAPSPHELPVAESYVLAVDLSDQIHLKHTGDP